MSNLTNLDYSKINNFLSEIQISEHLKLYQNYFNQSQTLPQDILKTVKENPTGVRGKQKTLQYALAGRDLHELYFLGMSDSKTSFDEINSELKNLIEKSFGSLENWAEAFKVCAMAARGWCILEMDPKTKILYNTVCDFHDEGFTPGFIPVLALDMYEHAYFFDYQTNKQLYINSGFEHINWQYIAKNLGL